MSAVNPEDSELELGGGGHVVNMQPVEPGVAASTEKVCATHARPAPKHKSRTSTTPSEELPLAAVAATNETYRPFALSEGEYVSHFPAAAAEASGATEVVVGEQAVVATTQVSRT